MGSVESTQNSVECVEYSQKNGYGLYFQRELTNEEVLRLARTVYELEQCRFNNLRMLLCTPECLPALRSGWSADNNMDKLIIEHDEKETDLFGTVHIAGYFEDGRHNEEIELSWGIPSYKKGKEIFQAILSEAFLNNTLPIRDGDGRYLVHRDKEDAYCGYNLKDCLIYSMILNSFDEGGRSRGDFDLSNYRDPTSAWPNNHFQISFCDLAENERIKKYCEDMIKAENPIK